jgi:6-phosphogluconolactonase
VGVNIFPDPAAAARAATDRIAGLVHDSTGSFTLAVAGGSTPHATFDLLSRESLPWDRVVGWLSDERWVPPDHERSNGAAAGSLLFDRVDARFLRPTWGEDIDPAASAADYEKTIRSIHADRRPDVIMLGIGDDGHTASLFPGTEALDEDSRWYVANHVPNVPEMRLTATYPLLWRARVLLLIVEGKAKAAALAGAIEGRFPSGRLAEGEADVEWYVDEEAASELA